MMTIVMPVKITYEGFKEQRYGGKELYLYPFRYSEAYLGHGEDKHGHEFKF